jgi:hypothetical protein
MILGWKEFLIEGDPVMKKYLFMILTISLVFGVSACNDDEDCVDCPDVTTPDPTMANIWPHADGTAWTFDGVYRELEPLPVSKIDDAPSPR